MTAVVDDTAQETAGAPGSGPVIVGAVGGTIISRDDPLSAVALTKEALGETDIAFCQVDTTFSRRGSPQLQALSAQRAAPGNAGALSVFSVASFASNHCMDWGVEAFDDTMAALRANGLEVVGAGRDIDEARKPAILDVRGTRVAFLAYNSILLGGYSATEYGPGCAPLRVHTAYIPIEPDQPGTPCRTHTFVDPADLAAMQEDVARAKSQSHVVFVSLHAGIHIQPAVIAAYQREAAHRAIDAGADIVFQHHGHILKGIEFYMGKPVIYSMGNYVMDIHMPSEEWARNPKLAELVDTYGIEVDHFGRGEYATYPFAPDARKTAIAKFEINGERLQRTSLLPAYIRPDGTPEVIAQDDRRAEEVRKYVEWATNEEELNAQFAWSGSEILVTPRPEGAKEGKSRDE